MKTQYVFEWFKYFHTEARDEMAGADRPSHDLRSGMMPIILPDEHSHFSGWAPPDHVMGLHIPHGSVTKE